MLVMQAKGANICVMTKMNMVCLFSKSVVMAS